MTNSSSGVCCDCLTQKDCLLATLPEHLLQPIQSQMQVRSYYGSRIIVLRQGQAFPGLFVLKEGRIMLSHLAAGDRTVSIGPITPGAILGLQELITGTLSAVRVEALDECKLEFVPQTKFLEMLHSSLPLAAALLKIACLLMVRHMDDFRRIEILTPRERFLKILRGLAPTGVKAAEGIRVTMPFSIQKLAEQLHCSRQWTYRLLEELEQQGRIKRGPGRTVLLKDAASWGGAANR